MIGLNKRITDKGREEKRRTKIREHYTNGNFTRHN